MLLHNSSIVGVANKTLVILVSHNATGGIRWFVEFYLDPLKECEDLVAFMITAEMQDKTVWSEIHVK